jgi:hypothetical protein
MKSKQLFFENLIAQNALGGIPAGYNFEGKTLYQIFSDLFKEGSVFTTIALEPNAGLEFNLINELRTKYNTLIPDGLKSQQINKLNSKDASIWKTKTIVQVLDDILFPPSDATYTIPTLSLAGTLPGPIYEVGTTQTNNLTLTGIKNDAGPYTSLSLFKDNIQISTVNNPTGSPQANQPQGSDYPNPNIPNQKYVLTYTNTFQITPGVITWIGKGNYDPGLPKKNSEGVDDPRPFLKRITTNPQAGDSNFESNSLTVEGIYPYYYGYLDTKPTAADIATLVNNYTADGPSINKVLRKFTSSEEVYFNSPRVGKWLWFAHTGSNKVSYITQNFSNPAPIGTGSPSALFPTIATQNFSTTNWPNVEFKVYIGNFATTTIDSLNNSFWLKFS